MNSLKLWPFFMLALLIGACGQDGLNIRTDRQNISANGAGIDTDAAAGCGCPLQFNPVCGQDNRTYDSSCIANCLNVSYTFGACDNNGKLNCSSTVQYVCAQPPMPPCEAGTSCAQVMPPAKAYLNLCQMIEAKAVFISNGVCP